MINHENTLTTSNLNKLKERPIEDVRIKNQRLKNKIKELEAGQPPKEESQRLQKELEELRIQILSKDQKITQLDKALAINANYIESQEKKQSKELKSLKQQNKDQIQEKIKQIEQYRTNLKQQNSYFLGKIEELSAINETFRLQLEEHQHEQERVKHQNSQLFEINQQITKQLQEKQLSGTFQQNQDLMKIELQIMKDNNDHYLQKIEDLNGKIHIKQQKIDKLQQQIEKQQVPDPYAQLTLSPNAHYYSLNPNPNPNSNPNLKKNNKTQNSAKTQQIEIELIKKQKEIASLTAQHKQKTEWFERSGKDSIYKVSVLTKQNQELADHIRELEDYIQQMAREGQRGGHDQYIMQLQNRLDLKEKDIDAQNELMDQLKEQNFQFKRKYFRSKQGAFKEEVEQEESLKIEYTQVDSIHECAQQQDDLSEEEEQGDNYLESVQQQDVTQPKQQLESGVEIVILHAK